MVAGEVKSLMQLLALELLKPRQDKQNGTIMFVPPGSYDKKNILD